MGQEIGNDFISSYYSDASKELKNLTENKKQFKYTVNLPDPQSSSVDSIRENILSTELNFVDTIDFISINNPIELENILESVYIKEDHPDNRELIPIELASPEQIKKAKEKDKLVKATQTIDENGNTQITMFLTEEQEQNTDLTKPTTIQRLGQPPKKINNVSVKRISEQERNSLYTATNVYLVYLKNKNELKNEKLKEKKEKSSEEIYNSHSTFTRKHTKLNNHQKNKEFFQLTLGFKDRNSLTRAETIHKQERAHQIESLKKEKLKEKHDKKKLEKKIIEHEYEILNDILKSTASSELLKKDITRIALLIKNIKNNFILTSYVSQAILKAD